MAVDRLETDTAVQALAHRLRDWGVSEPGVKARLFVDDLTKRGWAPHHDAQRRRPPRIEQECKTHAGEFAGACRGCASDRLTAGDAPAVDGPPTRSAAEVLAQIRATHLCPHKVTPTACPTCRTTATEPKGGA